MGLICEDKMFTRPVYFEMSRSVESSLREDSLYITLKNGKRYRLFFCIYSEFVESMMKLKK